MEDMLFLKKGGRRYNGISGPGPDVILKGDDVNGYFGFVGAEDLITGNALASLVGLTAGTAIAENSTYGWLKFLVDGKVLFVSKKPFRHSLGWAALNSRNIVYGNTELDIGEYRYKIRLIRGDTVNPTVRISQSGFIYIDTDIDDLTEWGRTIRMAQDGRYDNISLADLGQTSPLANATWCQESMANSTSGYNLLRGSNGSVNFFGGRNDAVGYRGWRPVLELIE